MADEKRDAKKPICHGAFILVLKVSRFFGIAPLTFAPEGMQFSLRYYIYSIVFITALKTTILVGFVMDVMHPKQTLRAATTHIIWLAYQVVLTAVTLVGCFAAPKRCRSMIDVLTRIEKIRDFLGDFKSQIIEVIYIYATIVSFLSVSVILSLMDWYYNLSAAYYLNKEVSTSAFSFFYVEYVIEILLEFQFMIVMFRLTRILNVVNIRLSKVLGGIEKQNLGNKNAVVNNFTLPPKDFLFTWNTNPMRVSEEESTEEIRLLWLVYELVCDLVRRVDRGYGLILLLLLQSFFLHFIMTPYYIINLYQYPTPVVSIGQQVAWFHFYAANVMLVVEPCHRVQQQMAKTHSLISAMMYKTRPYSPLSRCLAAFFRSLTLDQPQIAPLGMFVLERPLLITILGVVSAYLVPRHYFSVPNTNYNNTNDTNASFVPSYV